MTKKRIETVFYSVYNFLFSTKQISKYYFSFFVFLSFCYFFFILFTFFHLSCFTSTKKTSLFEQIPKIPQKSASRRREG